MKMKIRAGESPAPFYYRFLEMLNSRCLFFLGDSYQLSRGTNSLKPRLVRLKPILLSPISQCSRQLGTICFEVKLLSK